MPVTLQPTSLKYKDSNNVFQSATAIKGDDGYTPTITITDITGGHRVTITDATGPHSFDVMDGTGSVQDVQVNGVSVLSDGVANVPIADNNHLGAVKAAGPTFGVNINANGQLSAACVGLSEIKQLGGNAYKPLPSGYLKEAVFYGMAGVAGDTTQSASSNAVGNYTDAAKSAIHEMLSSSVSVSGTTPSITALPGIRYVCGEVSTLDITLPASGIVDVVFESGATATVLSGLDNVRWTGDFDPDNLEANTTYEINIADGLGVAGSWT